MNVVITLPQSLWKKIWRGEKTEEIRSVRPMCWNKDTDVVYVCLNGTRRIVGCLGDVSFEKRIGGG